MKYHSPWLELPAIVALPRRDREAMEAYQERQLLRLVKEVYHGNAFYRRIWDEAGFNPGQFRGRKDLDRLPLVTKQQACGQISMLREKIPGRYAGNLAQNQRFFRRAV